MVSGYNSDVIKVGESSTKMMVRRWLDKENVKGKIEVLVGRMWKIKRDAQRPGSASELDS